MRRSDPSDNGRNYFRSCTRIFNLNGAWYFGTREEDQGPFARKEIALKEVERYANERVVLRRFQQLAMQAEDLELAMLPIEESAANGSLA